MFIYLIFGTFFMRIVETKSCIIIHNHVYIISIIHTCSCIKIHSHRKESCTWINSAFTESRVIRECKIGKCVQETKPDSSV